MSKERCMRPNGADTAGMAGTDGMVKAARPDREDRRGRRIRPDGWNRALLVLAALILVALAGCSSADRDDAGSGNSSGNYAASQDLAAGSASSGGSGGVEPSGRPAEGGEPGRISGIAGNPQAAPGQLTAGEWRDVDRWDDWLKLLGGREGTENRNFWKYYRFDRLVVRAEAEGLPVADADVYVKDADGRVVWRTKTDMDGYAYAYAGMFERAGREPHMPEANANQDTRRASGRERQEGGYDRDRPGYNVEVRAGGESKMFSHVPIPRDQPLVVAFDRRPEPSNAVDLMFVVDTTGSMQDEIDFLREELKDVVTRARQGAGQLDVEVSVNFYRDRHDDYVVKPYPFTDDIDEVVRRIAQEKAEGGGDYPEAVEQALTNAVTGHEWRRSARTRLLFLVGDAPPRNEPQIIDELHEATLEAAKLGIRIVPVASSGIDVNTEYLMRFLAAATGGTYVFLTDHSGIGEDHLEAAVGEFEVRPLNDLLVEIIRRYAGLPPEAG